MTSACGGTIRHPRRSLVRLPSTNDSPRVLPGHGPAPRSLALILSSPPPGQGYSPLFRPDHALSGRLKRPIGQIFLAWRLSDFIPRRIRYLRPLHVARCQPSTLLLALPTFPSHKYSQGTDPLRGLLAACLMFCHFSTASPLHFSLTIPHTLTSSSRSHHHHYH